MLLKILHIAQLDFYSASLLKQVSACRHGTPLEYIILIYIQTSFALTPNTMCLVQNRLAFGLTKAGLEPVIYISRGEHAYYPTENGWSTIVRYQYPSFLLADDRCKYSDMVGDVFRAQRIPLVMKLCITNQTCYKCLHPHSATQYMYHICRGFHYILYIMYLLQQ